MNPNAKQYRVRPCVVCGYKFSDEHHIHPEVLGRDSSPTIILCPNHHRYAHILQGMVSAGEDRKDIVEFVEEHFEWDFVDIVDELLEVYGKLVAIRRNVATKNLARIKPVDFVFVRIRPYSSEERTVFDGYWGQVESVSTEIIKIWTNNTLFAVYPDEVEIIDGPTLQFKDVVAKVTQTLQRDDLDEFDKIALKPYLKRTSFTDRQIEILDSIWNYYQKRK